MGNEGTGADQQLGSFVAAVTERPIDLAARGVRKLYVVTTPDGEADTLPNARGEYVVFAYTGLRRLLAACGSGQPWARCGVATLVRSAHSCDVPLVVAVDVWHPEGARYPDLDIREMEPLEPAEHVPPIAEVWIASLPMAAGARQARAELYAPDRSQPVMLAYDSLEQLHTCCGPYQAAVSVRTEHLADVARDAGATDVVFGAVLDEQLRHQAGVLDWTKHSLFEPDDTQR